MGKKKTITRKIFYASLVCIGLSWIYILYSFLSLPFTLDLKIKNPTRTAYMDYYNGDKPVKMKWKSFNQISPNLRRAVILAEDSRFWKHHGFDWEAIKEAAEENWEAKSFVRGASTITQQLARNLYLSPAKNPFRKLKELFIAMKLERELSKQRILELYLNLVEWGDGIYGAEAAANHYFGISAAALDQWQAAYLSAMLPKPRYYQRNPESQYLNRRTEIVEGILRK
ncbi:MAG: monofunctional biosynthetic peptidoglycan transglycosylase [Pseudomonadota bacterium]